MFYRVEVDKAKNEFEANRLVQIFKNKGYQAYLTYEDNKFKVQIGSFATEHQAKGMVNRLAYEGYSSFIVESETIPQTKSIERLADECIHGMWGDGKDRITRIESAGYNYEEVQKKINEIMLEDIKGI